MKKYLGFIAATFLLVEVFGAGAAIADDKYGSVAANDDRSNYGVANNHSDPSQADYEALANCSGNCSIVMRYSNTCVAISKGDGVLGWAGEVDTPEDAVNAAQNACEAYADQRGTGGTCATVFSACTDR
jgi:hypothetical protein